ncbi:MAG: hypothetical protein KDA29_02755 [Phycisphaerales bacterium]|nr:hypothetical protein [Phycisphaerales bacterium]
MRESTPKPICPKCGYDQSGEIATWESQCPVHGVCSECGIRFQWIEVFRPAMHDLPWYAEHGRSIRSRLWRTPGTLRRLILPHQFWAQLGVTKRISVWGLCVWLLLIMLGMHLLIAIPAGWSRWDSRNWQGLSLDQYFMSYGYYGYAQILFDGIAHPFFYALPNSAGYIVSLDVYRSTWLNSMTMYHQFLRPMGVQVGFVITWIIVLFAIPQTRRLAKIRTGHLARAAILSMFAVVFSYEMHKLFNAMHGSGGLTRMLIEQIEPLFSLSMIIWQIAFWACAIVIGWRVEQWKLLVTLGTIAAILGGVTFRVYIFIMASS